MSARRPPTCRLRGACAALSLAASAVLAACGGGVYLAFWDDGDDADPTVSLTASPQSAVPGQTITLQAAASDDSGIDSVVFYRVEAGGNGSTRLARVCCAPYRWTTPLPDTASGSVSYFARAVDFAGNVTQSDAVAVNVAP